MADTALSVIVPAHNAAPFLPDTLGALAASTLPRESWELVLVDDASTDNTAAVAGPFADQIVCLHGNPHGPAHARNRGVDASRGGILVFVDADVRVHPDTLDRVARAFADDPELAAVFGSYDDRPEATELVSVYRNLLHHYHHQRWAGEAETFWAGLGAVRRGVFAEVGGFDEARYHRPRIEDIELGRRIRRGGHRIVLDPAIQGTHLKRWTVRDLVVTDLIARGIPWVRLILSERGGGGTLNVAAKEKVATAFLGLSLVAGGIAAATGNRFFAAAFLVLLLLVIGLNVDLYRFMARTKSPTFAACVIPLHLLYYVVSGLAVVLGFTTHFLRPETDLATKPAGQQVRKDRIAE